MTSTPDTSTSAVSRPRSRRRAPLWLIEGLDILERRRPLIASIVVVLCAVGFVLAATLPSLVPPTAPVGAAVAVASLLLGLAVAVAVDATDLTVRGPRHVNAAGGSVRAVLPSRAGPERIDELVEAVLVDRGGEGPLQVALAAAGRDPSRTVGITDALAVALAHRGVSVLRVDVASGSSGGEGLVEVVHDGRRLSDVVAFEPGLRLARLDAGRNHAAAVEAVPILRSRLPRNLDVLLVALPTAASRQVVDAAESLDRVLVVAERDRTSRVDLIAAIDAMEVTGNDAEVVLLDDRTAAHLAPAATLASNEPAEAEEPDASGAEGEPAEPSAAAGPDESADTTAPGHPTDPTAPPEASGAADPDEPGGTPAPDGPSEPAVADAADADDAAEVDDGRVDVLIGAAEARALSAVDDQRAPDTHQVETGAEDPPVDRPLEAVAGPADRHPDAPDDRGPAGEKAAGDDARTDELPSIDLGESDPDEGLLRETAQLSLLREELELRAADGGRRS